MLKKKLKYLLIILICFLKNNVIISQITVNNNKTATQLINDIFIGSGVKVQNIIAKGVNTTNKYQYGDFITSGSTLTKLGFKSGIIMTSGNTKDIPQNPCSNLSTGGYFSSTPGEFRNDPDAKILGNNGSLYNTCIIEFDFITSGDSIMFNYIFGSAEYPTYNCTNFNDAFGFLLSGPGISGGRGFTNDAKNLALLPGTNTDVTINNVNDGSTSGTYCTLTTSERTTNFNGNIPNIGYCGLTKPLKAKHKVTPCVTYHIKLIITDISDGAMDSGVFLEAGSFSSPGVDASSQITDALGNPLTNNYITENCSKAVLTFKANPIPTSDYTINYTLGGTAINNTDYTIPSNVKILAGQSSTQLTITPTSDNLDETDETITIQLNGQTTCTGTTPTQTPISITIKDELKVSGTKTSEPTCNGNTVNSDGVITLTAKGGVSPYSYSLDNGNTFPFSNSPISTIGNGTYNIKVKDKDGCIASDITAISINKNCGSICSQPTIITQPNNSSICENSNTSFSITSNGGNGQYQWQVNTGSGFTNITNNTVYSGSTTTTLYLTNVPLNYSNYKFQCIVKEAVGTCPKTSNDVNITINPKPVFTNVSVVCAGSTLTSATVNGTLSSGTMEYSLDGSTYVSNKIFTSGITVGSNQTFYIRNQGTSCTISGSQLINCNCPTVTGNTISSAQSICNGETPNALTGILPTINPVTTFTYQWQSSSDNSTWTDIIGATNKDYSPGAISQTTFYRRKIKITNCPDDNSSEIKITINPKPVLTINTPAAVCSPATLDLTSNAIISGSTGVLVGGISYWTDAGANTPATNTTAINTTGTFYIKAVNGICSDIKPVTLTINSCSCPVALNITNPSAVCSPFGVDLTSSSITAGSTGVGSFTYWEDATASTTPLTNFNNVTVGKTYYIKMSGGACTDIKPVVVTINQSPILKITDPTAVCSPNTVNITSSSITAGSTGGGTLSYWKDQLATNNLSNPSLINISDIYYIKSTTTAGCSDIKPVNVSIGTKPTLIITNPTSVCSPNTIDLTLSSVTSGSTNVNTLTYWQDPVASLVLTNAGNINSSNTFYIKAENGNCYDIKPVVVTIKPSPDLKITNPSEICEPNTVNLLDPSITNGSSNIGSLSYFSDQNLTIPINNPSNYNQIGTNTLYISTTNSNGCSDSKPVKVIINPLDIINITSPTSLCSNAPLEKIVATPTNGTWIGKGIKSDGSLQASLATIGLNDYTYTSSGKCPTNKTIQITIKEKPDLKISSKDTVCEKEDVLFQDVSINTNLVKCEWRFGDNTNSTILKETKHAYLNAGDYDVTLIGTDAQGCSDTIIENKFVHVLIRPKTKFSFEPLKPTIFNNSIQTTNLTTDATNYLWDFGDDTKTTLVNPSHKYGNTPNIYIITLNAYNKITSCNHDTTIEVEIFDEIYCYVPNSFTPNGDELNNEFKPILSGSVAEENYSLYIFNRWGQLLFESHNKNVGWNGAFGNKISAPGTYIWKIEFTDTINKVKHMKTGHINLVN